jgi:glycosyltransferase involved in cell wall biosynthesis
MRIAIVHSFYASGSPSGENSSVLEQESALRDAGHEVVVVARHTDLVSGDPLFKARSALNVVTGRGYDPSAALSHFRPDVVHVHNLFPNIGHQWLANWPGPIVHTLHNYRPLCANGLLFRDGDVCTLCPDGQPWSAVKERCYHSSRIASLPLAIRNRRGLRHDPLLGRSDAAIFLSESARRTYVKYGADPGRAHVIPNGWAAGATYESGLTPETSRWVGAGRLTSEKGFLELARIWPRGRTLEIFGDGPQLQEIAALGRPEILLRGEVPRADLLRVLPTYLGLVIPSLCLEMQPSIAVEAMASGLPLVVRKGGAAEAMVNEHGVGESYRSEASLSEALEGAERGAPAARTHARHVYESHFTLPIWVDRLVDLYERLVHFKE